MHGICNSVSDPLNIRYVLDYIAADNNYLNICSHIYVQCRKQNRDKPTTKCKIKFSKVLQSLYRTKSNTSDTLYIHLVETFALILHSKIIFKKLFWL